MRRSKLATNAATLAIYLLLLFTSQALAVSWNTNNPLLVPRVGHSATLISDGKLLVAGGSSNSIALASAEIYDPLTGKWTPAGIMQSSHYGHTATFLPNGKVLVAGGYTGNGNPSKSAELYDPIAGTWSLTGPLTDARVAHRATLLHDGRVLVEGGYNGSASLSSAELYDSAAGTWSVVGAMSTPRQDHSATLLPEGTVLVAGGDVNSPSALDAAEIYDPTSATWSLLRPLHHARHNHTASLLPNGTVLVVGGSSGSGTVAIPEQYDPLDGTWTDVSTITNPRYEHTATLLPNGQLLIVGGTADGSSYYSSSEIYDPVSAKWNTSGPLATQRDDHTATLLPNGQVLVVGGRNSAAAGITSTELYDSASSRWNTTDSLASARKGHSATLLPDGTVMIAGGTVRNDVFLASAETYNPNTGEWTTINSLQYNRYGHTATLLPNGRVLVVGGALGGVALGFAEQYDPVLGYWTNTQALATARYEHTATLLPNGKVLVAGGTPNGVNFFDSSDLYDPGNNTWVATAFLNTQRGNHSATLLSNGKVLVAGGQGQLGIINTSEVYDAVKKSWLSAGPMKTARTLHTATLLPNGQVLIAGGQGKTGITNAVEIYDPPTSTWTTIGPMNIARAGHTAILLSRGVVLVVGGTGTSGSVLNSAEIYDPLTGKWTLAGTLTDARVSHRATLLPNGKVLIEGGDSGGTVLASAELFDPGIGFAPAMQAQVSPVTPVVGPGSSLVMTGSNFRGISESSGGNGTQDSSADHPVVQLRSLENEQMSFLVSTIWSTDSLATVPLVNFAPGYALATLFVNGVPSTSAFLDVSVSGPSVSLTSPTSGTTFPAGTNLLIIASAQDSGGTITNISFFDHLTNLLGVATGGATSITLNNVSLGKYLLTAIATDDKGVSSASVPVNFTVVGANHAPTFLKGPDLVIGENAGPQNVTNWATAISPGSPGEIGQHLQFSLSNDNPALFSSQPTLSANGLLSFTPAADDTGMATVTVVLKDDGGTANGGQDTSPPQTFTITVQQGAPGQGGSWGANAPLLVSRVGHSATLLADGKVLVAGGSTNSITLASVEVYDPLSGNWASAADMNSSRRGQTATLLPNGRVLIAGGYAASGSPVSNAELYDPISGTWTLTQPMNEARAAHRATLLANGKVLVDGGYNGNATLATAEVYDPATGTWAEAGTMTTPRQDHTATLLRDGTVLVTGGDISSGSSLTGAEVYDPSSGIWTLVHSLNHARNNHTATLLPSGKVLVIGGSSGSNAVAIAERYDPVVGTWNDNSSLIIPRYDHTATLLPSGQILITGGTPDGNSYLSSSEIYDPLSSTWKMGAPLSTERDGHTATLLANGKVLVAGGKNNTSEISSTELYNSSSPSWSVTGTLADARKGHSATLLPDGTVMIVAGTVRSDVFLASAETYNPDTGEWTTINSLHFNRYGHTATLLPNGRVLVVGGALQSTAVGFAEQYDPVLGYWTNAQPLANARYEHTATLLPNGKVLVAGGTPNGVNFFDSADLYDPSGNSWTATATMSGQHANHTATLLTNGKVLVAGGQGAFGITNAAELYDPVNMSWSTVGSMKTARRSHSATLLPNGKVLIAGGQGKTGITNVAEIYDPVSATWTVTGVMNNARASHTATLLPSGVVLVVGGNGSSGVLDSAEIYDPLTGKWRLAGTLTDARVSHRATLLPTGKVLIEGGDSGGTVLASAELFDPGIGFTPAMQAQASLVIPLVGPASSLVMTGSNFRGVSESSGGNGTQDSPADHPIVQLRSLENEQTSFLDSTFWCTDSLVTVPLVNFPPGYALATLFVNAVPSTSALLDVSVTGPSVSLTSPTNGATFSAGTNLPIITSAQDPGGTITNITFFDGLTNLLGVAASGATSITLNNVPAGNYLLTAVATDDKGVTSTSVAVNFRIFAVAGANHAPTFLKGPDLVVGQNAGPQNFTNWATAISPGPPDEAGQHLQFSLTNNNSALFSSQPTLGTNGVLSFTPAGDVTGIAIVTVVLKDDGGIANGGQDTSPPQTFKITINPVNNPPSFTKGPDITVNEDAGPQIFAGWATAISAGPPSEASQHLTFTVISDNSGLFAVGPQVNTNGTLTFATSPDSNGIAHITVVLKDDGGTANGGLDTSAPQFFTITVNPVNDPPVFTKGPDITVNEDAGPQVFAGWATGISAGPTNETSQLLNFILTSDNVALFASAPSLDTNGTLTFTTATNANGSAHVTVVLKDNGGTANGGQDTSAPQIFTIVVRPVNDPPSFTKGPDVTVEQNSGPQVLAGWAAAISAGPPDEASQTLTFIVTNDNPALFSALPAISTNGTLTFTGATNAAGLAHVTVVLKDNGGTANGGQDTSAPQLFNIVIRSNNVNVAPSFTKGPDVTVNEDAGPQSIPGWATAISPGPANEASQTLVFIVTSDNLALFSSLPTLNTNGTLSFTTATNANGAAHVTVTLKDNGGTANGGQDTSPPQTFTITVNPVNDPPSFLKGPDVTIGLDSGAQVLAGWATAISPGPPDEASQILSFIVTNNNPTLFSVPPAVGTNGTLTFTPSGTSTGVVQVTVILKDNGGIANGGQDTSAPQIFKVTITGPAAPPNVAVISRATGYDFGNLITDIGQVSLPAIPSLSAKVFQTSGLSFQTLSKSQLVIWYDADGTQQTTQDEVSLLQQLYTNGMPLLFAGPRVSSAASTLPPATQAVWQSLVHLSSSGGTATAGPVIPQPDAGGNPLLNGPYGFVDTFNVQTDADQATVTPDADSVAQMNGADVMATFPSINDPNQDQIRTTTMLFALDSPTDTNSFVMRRGVFQNAICWLLYCGACSAVYPSFGFDIDPLTPETGVPVTINLRLGNSGECDAVEFVANVRLADGLQFVSATSDLGKVTQSNQLVSLAVTRIAGRQTVDLSITVVAQAPGWFTNQVDLETATTTPQTRTAGFEVQGVAIPQFSIQRSGANAIVLTLINAQAGSSFALQRAILLPNTSTYLWTTFTNFSFSPPQFQTTDQIPPTSSAVLYRVMPQ